MKKCIVFGVGGFIGYHLAKRLRDEGNCVYGVDLKKPEYGPNPCNAFIIGDLREKNIVSRFMEKDIDECYQLAADMGGAGFVFTGEHDEEIITSNALINLNVALNAHKVGRVFYSSSACTYGPHLKEQKDFKENNAIPASPDSIYGWEKLFSELVYLSLDKAKSIVRIARYHNIFGSHGTYEGGREKAPAAMCRKVAMAKDGDTIEIWGDGQQIRSFLYIDDCIDGTLEVMRSRYRGPFNIGSEVMISITDLAKMVCDIAGKKLNFKYIPGPIGVNKRTSNNERVEAMIGWKPKISLYDGLKKTYEWINGQVRRKNVSVY